MIPGRGTKIPHVCGMAKLKKKKVQIKKKKVSQIKKENISQIKKKKKKRTEQSL